MGNFEAFLINLTACIVPPSLSPSIRRRILFVSLKTWNWSVSVLPFIKLGTWILYEWISNMSDQKVVKQIHTCEGNRQGTGYIHLPDKEYIHRSRDKEELWLCWSPSDDDLIDRWGKQSWIGWNYPSSLRRNIFSKSFSRLVSASTLICSCLYLHDYVEQGQ